MKSYHYNSRTYRISILKVCMSMIYVCILYICIYILIDDTWELLASYLSQLKTRHRPSTILTKFIVVVMLAAFKEILSAIVYSNLTSNSSKRLFSKPQAALTHTYSCDTGCDTRLDTEYSHAQVKQPSHEEIWYTVLRWYVLKYAPVRTMEQLLLRPGLCIL